MMAIIVLCKTPELEDIEHNELTMKN